MIVERIIDLGLKLPSPSKPAGSYVPVVMDGNMIYVSGQIALESSIIPEIYRGKVTSDVSIETAQAAARICTLNALSQIKAALGDLDRVKKFIRLSGYVNSDPSFTDQPKVINAASDLLADIFGDAGKHSRVAIGVSSLPLGSAVEIEFLAKSDMM
ncbi:MAG TPA: RidA family protein [Nitrososphaeraceae archaeon]|nr:RidA family protein [Nitrososphaeraceae archaeon]